MITTTRTCAFCNTLISAARLEALLDTITCVDCSDTTRYQGAAEGLSKSHTVLHVLDPNTSEGREAIGQITRYTPYRFGNSVMCTGSPQRPFGKE